MGKAASGKPDSGLAVIPDSDQGQDDDNLIF
jgi:hypothetical protein